MKMMELVPCGSTCPPGGLPGKYNFFCLHSLVFVAVLRYAVPVSLTRWCPWSPGERADYLAN